MGVFIGFVVGYLFGVSNGPIDLEEISEAWQEIKQSEDFQAFMAGGAMMARQALDSGASAVAEEAAAAVTIDALQRLKPLDSWDTSV
jgi:hypothetical protein